MRAIRRHDLGYIAGLIDGEGCIHIGKKEKTTYYRISVSNNNWDCLRFIQKRVGYGTIRPVNTVHWVYTIDRNQVILDLLSLVQDSLIVKRKKARAVIKLIRKRNASIREKQKREFLKTGKIPRRRPSHPELVQHVISNPI